MNHKWTIVIALALAAGIGAYLYFYQARPQPGAAAMAELQAPAAKLVATVPDFSLLDRDGEKRSLADWQGRALIVNFWATWCAPCRREIPLLQQLQIDYGDRGFQVVGIAVDFRDAVLSYANEMGIEYPILIGEQDALDAAAAFGVEAVGFPFTIFTDRQGRVVAAHVGELDEAQARVILKAVGRVNDGELTPTAARQIIESELYPGSAKKG
jgi:thiol-disulfide isomerase/thioredoxin